MANPGRVGKSVWLLDCGHSLRQEIFVNLPFAALHSRLLTICSSRDSFGRRCALILQKMRMSIPRNHHYLPQFYLERWAQNGSVYRYIRPRGRGGLLECKRKAIKGIAYERDLYHLPDIDDPVESQSLELRFFQRIDDRAAIALRKLDNMQRGTIADRTALSEFVISLLHRSPSRLAAIKTELAVRTDGAPYEGKKCPSFEILVKATANRLLAHLVDSEHGKSIISNFKIFKINVRNSKKLLLTSDRPISVSADLVSPDAFITLPYAPDRLLVLTSRESVARAFSSQDPTALVVGINKAIVEQSEDIVIAADSSASRMIDRLFLRHQTGTVTDSIGLIRRKAPLIEGAPPLQRFSRHNKKAIRYLG